MVAIKWPMPDHQLRRLSREQRSDLADDLRRRGDESGLESLSDALQRIEGRNTRKTYTEAEMDCEMRRDTRNATRIYFKQRQHIVNHLLTLLSIAVDELVRTEVLSQRASDCFCDKLSGLTYTEIAGRRDVSVRTAKYDCAHAAYFASIIIADESFANVDEITPSPYHIWWVLMKTFGEDTLNAIGYTKPAV